MTNETSKLGVDFELETTPRFAKMMQSKREREDNNMIIEHIGLNRYLHTYSLKDDRKFTTDFREHQRTGTVKEVFINNRLAFEYQENKVITQSIR